jgi:hypothetical protein
VVAAPLRGVDDFNDPRVVPERGLGGSESPGVALTVLRRFWSPIWAGQRDADSEAQGKGE